MHWLVKAFISVTFYIVSYQKQLTIPGSMLCFISLLQSHSPSMMLHMLADSLKFDLEVYYAVFQNSLVHFEHKRVHWLVIWNTNIL